ncbi:hypothetical protein [Methylococcus sp. EFPC2]|nr:hypothetical protein [Methylococcus sp. EFPC2]
MTKAKAPKSPKSAIKTELFAAELRKEKIYRMGDPLLAFTLPP